MQKVGLPRTCLGCTNMIFFLLSAVGLIICVWCAISTDFFREVNYTVTRSTLVSSIANFVNLKLWFTPLTTILIPVAIFSMVTSCCGILGAGCKSICAVKTYVLFVTIICLTVVWIFFISILYNIHSNNTATKHTMQSMIHNDYGKKDGFMTFLWNYIMTNYECCGVDSYKDFANSNWSTVNKDKLYPIQCCHIANKTAIIATNVNCTKSYNVKESYLDTGCFEALRNSIAANKGKLIFYLLLCGWMYGVLMLFAYCIIKGQPILGALAGDFQFLSKAQKPQDVQAGAAPNAKVAPSGSSLQNMLFMEEPPHKVTKVVSAFNPFQAYKLQPQQYGTGPVMYQQTMRPHLV